MTGTNEFKIMLSHYIKYLYYKEVQKTARFKYINQYGAIFIHIPKAAGTSVYMSLFGTIGGGHVTAENYKKIYGPNKFKAYYKFTFVRNPFDRLLSAYNYLNKGGMSSDDQNYYNKYISQYTSFEDFVINGLAKNKNIQKGLHFLPQYKFLTIGDKISQIYIGRFENIEKDFKYIANTLGIDKELKRLNSSNRQQDDYRSFYTEKSKKIVEQIYKKDLELFNYTF